MKINGFLRMKILKMASLQYLLLIFLHASSGFCRQRPAVVNIAAIISFDSVIGRAAKTAMEIAVSDVNADSSILNGTLLNLTVADSNCSVFMGSMRAFQLIEREPVSILGPQSSAIAHMISHIANALQVPLISFAASDPTLSALQFPFFVRSTQSDSYQMAAMAEIINYYGWKEVIAIFVDNEFGRNGIYALRDELASRMSKISYKLPLPENYNLRDVTDVLNRSKVLGPRVFVVHMNPDPRLRFFKIAHTLKMMSSDFVWLSTDWLSCTLDSFLPEKGASLKIIDGVVGLRPYIPQTSQRKAFMSRWRKAQPKALAQNSLNVYGLYAYDTVWIVAYSIDKFLNEQNLTFSFSDKLNDSEQNKLQLGKLKVFEGGNALLQNILMTNFTGLTGLVKFNQDRNILSSGYEVINIVNSAIRKVGYWSNSSGLSVLPPDGVSGKETSPFRLSQMLDNITWPGRSDKKPRGWVLADSGRPLRIGIPRRVSFVGFVSELNHSHEVQGYCPDIFKEATRLVPYDLPFRFVPFGNGLENPSYDELVRMVAEDVFDAAVGDIAIVTNRTKIVDFTQPYVATGLVIVAPLDSSKSNAWVFLKPFTPEMWSVTAAFFLIIAMVIWILEHRVNGDFRGPPKRQLITMILFSFSTLFKTNQENTVSTLGRMVMVVWLFLLLVVTSSYTASLTSVLTVQQLSSSITGVDSLITSEWRIGYQTGSFAYSYMRDNLNIPHRRLVPLGSPEAYEEALRKGPTHGGVGAIVDELPYVELFLSTRTDFGIIGQPFTKSGWGFAFQKDSPLAIDMSTAILKLAENAKLQEINKNWFCKTGCPSERKKKIEPNQLHLRSFWALYFLCGAFTLAAFLIFLARMIRQYMKFKRKQMESSSPWCSTSSRFRYWQVVYSFCDFIDEKEEAIKRFFTQQNSVVQSQVA